MYKQLIILVFCSISFFLESMEKKYVWIKTSDGCIVKMPPRVGRHCNRAPFWYVQNLQEKKCIGLAVDYSSMKKFFRALRNPAKIQYDSILTLLDVSEKCGAFLFHAFCLNNYLEALGVAQLDEQFITPSLQGVRSELSVILDSNALSQDVILRQLGKINPWNGFIDSNKDYILTVKPDATPRRGLIDYQCYYKDKAKRAAGNIGHFTSRISSVFNKTPYLFKSKNVALFYLYNNFIRSIFAALYDLDEHKTIMLFKTKEVFVANNEQCMVSINVASNTLTLYNCMDMDNIQIKTIPYRDGFDFYELSENSERLFVTNRGQNELSASVYNIKDIDWSTGGQLQPFCVIDLDHEDQISGHGWTADSTIFYINMVSKKNGIPTSCYQLFCVQEDKDLQTTFGKGRIVGSTMLESGMYLISCIEDEGASCFLTVYSIYDLKNPLFKSSNEHARLSPDSPHYLASATNESLSKWNTFEYNKKTGRIEQMAREIEGSFQQFNNKGWALAGEAIEMGFAEFSQLYVYNKSGRKILNISSSDSEVGFLDPYIWKNKKLIMKTYSEEKEFNYAIDLGCLNPKEMFNSLNCPQLALFMSIEKHSDACVFPKSLKKIILDSFGPGDIKKVEKLLAIQYQ